MSPLNKKKKSFWRSFGQLENTQKFRDFLHREFQKDASVFPEDGVTRRSFLKLLGASAALAGLAGCDVRRPKRFITPYVSSPESFIPGKTVYYATSMALGEEVTGVLVESSEGRPIKIEGNPSHPGSLGAVKGFQQASVLDLYDPDRLKKSRYGQDHISLAIAKKKVQEIAQKYRSTRGQGLAIVTEAQVSPTFYRLLHELQETLPLLSVHRFEAYQDDAVREGIHAVSQSWVRPSYQFGKANIIVGFGSDFLGAEWNSIPNIKSFSKRRDPDSEEGMNRLYMVESTYTITGAKADHRIRVKQSDIKWVLLALCRLLLDKQLIDQSALRSFVSQVGPFRNPSGVELRLLDAIALDLVSSKGRSLVTAGYQQPPVVHALVYMLNDALGNNGKTVVYFDQPFSSYSFNQESSLSSLTSLVDKVSKKEIETLLVMGGNPAYLAPADLEFDKKMHAIPQVVTLSSSDNETTHASGFVIPRSHYLEAWSDLVSLDGTLSIGQPLIKPLYESLSDHEFLSLLLGKEVDGCDLVRQSHGCSSAAWEEALRSGILTYGASSRRGSLGVQARGMHVFLDAFSKGFSSGLELTFYPSYSLYDGRYANNGWLQETPDPISKLTWDNALFMSQATAKKYHIAHGDLVTVSFGGRKMDVAACIQPGQADNTCSMAIGYGRNVVGRVGEKAGFNANSLRVSSSYDTVIGVRLRSTGQSYVLATTQEHGSMEGRPIYRYTDLEDYKKDPYFAKEMVEHPPLVSSWPEKKYEDGYQWGMTIDLNKCIGCNACTTACQAENNIPIVGKSQVLNAREMHWIRIDRYYEGTVENPKVLHQPLTCMQCEMAPCEQVCPVAATTHSEEGLNDMAYNRCVGTRYCANNCPVKVRRFNFFDFHQRNPQAVDKERIHLFDYFKQPDKTVRMQFNPDVTVRMRGVMEKCTFCVQRINEAKIMAKNEFRLVKDGEIKTACQQTCPADAIIFGNILDLYSDVAKSRKRKRDYKLLEELNLKPRLSYLAGVMNPYPFFETSDQHLAESRPV